MANLELAYGSRFLNVAEGRYSGYRGDFLALKWSVSGKFLQYLYRNKFHVVADSNPLTYLLLSAKLSATDHRCMASLFRIPQEILTERETTTPDLECINRCIRMLCPNTCPSLRIVKHKRTFQP